MREWVLTNFDFFGGRWPAFEFFPPSSTCSPSETGGSGPLDEETPSSVSVLNGSLQEWWESCAVPALTHPLTPTPTPHNQAISIDQSHTHMHTRTHAHTHTHTHTHVLMHNTEANTIAAEPAKDCVWVCRYIVCVYKRTWPSNTALDFIDFVEMLKDLL